eukprot:TRINITY_DN3149_c0_g2_i21.p1 TRINITY_DN3149_c0_g2~~TRINITY_DN3149_c0_g2_i21.p1  ORF type:complete len:297 (-),score=32.30 TRINITY_DN3149_c0_g2_i21:760-1650(-)
MALTENVKFSLFFLVMQLICLFLFVWTVDYAEDVSAKSNNSASVGITYALFQDVHVMVYVGFGFLLVFTGRHQWSSVGFVFMVSALTWQWSILNLGFWDKVHSGEWHTPIPVNIISLINADFSAATVMVSLSGVLGKCSPLQYLVMGWVEVIFISINVYICLYQFQASDLGGTMVIHVFGAYYGLACSWALWIKTRSTSPFHHPSNFTTYSSDTFAMVGTLFLWLFWPSFNGAVAYDGAQHRAVINTLFSIVASCGMTFCVSSFFRTKFGMVSGRVDGDGGEKGREVDIWCVEGVE